VTIALSDKFSTLDTLTSASPASAADERIRNLIFNALVKKNDEFEYVGELASEIKVSEDNRTITFLLHEGVKFHNGKDFAASDVKYTFDQLMESNGYKSGAFFDTVDDKRVPHISAINIVDSRTIEFTVSKPALKNQLLSNLVAIPIIAEGTVGQLKESPIGTGPFRFVNFDPSQNIVEMEANVDYWEGKVGVQKLRVKALTDASSLQAELQTGAVDLAPLPTNLPPDTLRSLGELSNLNVEQFIGSNLQYLIFNVESPPLNDVKIRQAISHAIDREKIIRELLFGQARIAHSILPPESRAYSAGNQYGFDPAKARQLLQEAGYKGEPIVFKYAAGNAAVSQYAQVIQSSLNDVGLNVQIETLEPGTIRQQLTLGQFQMYTAVWTGGNQDPIFLKDLFTTGRIPGEGVPCCNRGRYSNKEVDKLINNAINEIDNEKARELYVQAWELISHDVPMLPLWYPANMVVANKRIGSIKISPSGDWGFVKNITVNN
jgi:peptide/nickel transport system substrate-binding protein